MTGIREKRDDIVWHYTVGIRFREIRETGAIIPATARVPPGERAIVWFSSHPEWEPTASKGIIVDGTMRKATRDEMVANAGGLVRLGVSRRIARHDWTALRTKSRMSAATAKGLVAAARECGADPAQWFGSFTRVARQHWCAVDVWDAGVWVPLDLSETLSPAE